MTDKETLRIRIICIEITIIKKIYVTPEERKGSQITKRDVVAPSKKIDTTKDTTDCRDISY